MSATEVPFPTTRSRPGSEHARLQAELGSEVDGEIRFDEGTRAAYATDASNFRQLPAGVVVPRTVEALAAAVSICAAHGMAVTHRGGGTSLAGQCCSAGVVIDGSKYLRRIHDIDPDRRLARVEPGVVLDQLRSATGRFGLTFGPDPATHDHCTLGGMIGNNSCGVHSVMAGRTADNVEALDVITADGLRFQVGRTDEDQLAELIARGGRTGAIYAGLRDLRDRCADRIRDRYPPIPRRVSGYNLDELLPEKGFDVARALVGSEGTCVTVLGATVRLVPDPPCRITVALGYPEIEEAAAHVGEIMRFGPVGLEAIDHTLIVDEQRRHLHPEDLDLLPDGRGFLLVELGGDSEDDVEAQASELAAALQGGPNLRRFDDPRREARVWEIRESALGATARVPGGKDAWPGWEDSAVPPERLAPYLRDLRSLYAEHGVDGSLYGHFGQGCVHSRITFDLESAGGIDRYRRFLSDAADLVVSYGGSLSGEHGDGQQRAALLDKMFGTDLVRAFGQFKALWDPDDVMNPGKIVHPARPDQHLRLGPDHQPLRVQTTFAFADDDGSLARATQRCVGVGACRRTDGGTMCPSFMVTHEEIHSTRGRAHLLWELLNGDELGGWESPAVAESLDLCLSCKGCKSDCPVDVDIATYKAEFLSHHHRHRLRPRPAYAMGLVSWWARLASLAPRLSNALARRRWVHDTALRLAGLTVERPIPTLATPRLTRRLADLPRLDPSGPTVAPTGARGRILLWPDTFTEHFDAEIGVAAVEALEALGFEVVLPRRRRCCGRPLYDYGMLSLARRWLEAIVDDLRDEIRAGTPVVVLEPSCLAVFRDELTAMLPHDHDAQRLAGQTFSLAELIAQHVDADELGAGPGPDVLYHPHCHQGAVVGTGPDHELLSRLGCQVADSDAGCCGLAGSFGFEAPKYDLSVAIGERKLAPLVAELGADHEVVADGFSCRTQVAHLTGRRPRHVAELLRDRVAPRRRTGGRRG